VWDGHLKSRRNPDRLKRSIHVDRIGVHSTFVYIYAELRVLHCLFSFNMSFLLRKVEDVTTISKSQSLTSVSIKDCTLRVPNETTTLFLLRVIIKAIFIHATPKTMVKVSKQNAGRHAREQLVARDTVHIEASEENIFSEPLAPK